MQHLGQLVGGQEDRVLDPVDVAQRGDRQLAELVRLVLAPLDPEVA